MTKSELIELLVQKNHSVPVKSVEEAVKAILESGERIEVRGFGSFSLHCRQPRLGRNPKTGEQVKLDAKCVPYFKAGKELRERVDVYA